MVFFVLLDENVLFLRYEYYPEGNKNLKPGIIKVDLVSQTMDVEVQAETDKLISVSKDGQDELKDFINELRLKDGEAELSADEWPDTGKSLDYYLYASAAMEKIAEGLNGGEVIKEGSNNVNLF